MKKFIGFWPFMLVLVVTCGLVFIEPHLSGTILILAIGMVMMFIGDLATLSEPPQQEECCHHKQQYRNQYKCISHCHCFFVCEDRELN